LQPQGDDFAFARRQLQVLQSRWQGGGLEQRFDQGDEGLAPPGYLQQGRQAVVRHERRQDLQSGHRQQTLRWKGLAVNPVDLTGYAPNQRWFVRTGQGENLISGQFRQYLLSRFIDLDQVPRARNHDLCEGKRYGYDDYRHRSAEASVKAAGPGG
jgi:hypothetical protein